MNFTPLLQPASLAVVGLSLQNDRHPANVIYNKNRLRYPLAVFPVNPRGGVYRGDPVYPRLTDLPAPVDLVVIAVRAEHVPAVMEDCVRAGARGAVVISGGFTETGRGELQDRLTAIAREAGLPFLGPNCIGIHSPGRVDTFFLPTERMVLPLPGSVALVSQSGGILVDQMLRFAGEGVGLSVAISIGNKALVKEVDLLRHLEDDPRTKVAAFYVEGFGRHEGREFFDAARACRKPVIVLKGGKSPGGSRAVSSHTASLAGDYAVASAAFAQAGVIEARDDLELISFCEALSTYPAAVGGAIGVVTGSGGHGALAVDIAVARGLAVPALDEAAQAGLRATLSESIREIASTANPVDLTGSAVDDDFLAATAGLCRRADIACVVVLLLPYLPGMSLDIGARLGHLYQRERKPVIAYVPRVEKFRMLIEGFELNGIPVASSIEGAVLMARALQLRRPGGGAP